ncbi:hypothetical protein OSB04_016347 [Centaurea solstitialis]|uniref:Integrase catalytic domain-containing protein n=1 Tax=Centaurea solstitialis TaxID=347529 RepID=A0AA38W9Q5_9ASTR|nr:hypothetical protein OSB04_016347 [Centaurea solstitialis]
MATKRKKRRKQDKRMIKRSIRRGIQEHRLDDLPESLQLQILSFLDAKQAVQTSALSKPWLSIWTYTPVLRLNCIAFRRLHAFDRFVHKVLTYRDHSVTLDTISFTRGGVSSAKILKEVLNYALSHRVNHLELSIQRSRSRSWPPVCQHNTSLDSLKTLTLKSESYVSCPFLLGSAFRNLTVLYLKSAMIEDLVPFSRFPLLERLVLNDCRFGETLSVEAGKLSHLTVLCHGSLDYLELKTPNLKLFEFIGSDFPELQTYDCVPFVEHCRLGHTNKKRIEQLQKGGLLGSFDFRPFNNCESCLSGKMTKQPFNKDNERANELLGIIHTNVCGPFSHEARGGYRYFITFTDDFSKYGYVYLIRHKSEAFERFKEFLNEVQNQLDRKIKFLRSDRGGEYLSQEFDNHLMECGIVSQLTPPYTPQMNGVSERRNRTLLDMVRNEVYVKRPTSEKLKPKSDKCIFVGYPKTTVEYYFYNPTENKVFVARNGEFLEDKFLSTENTRNDVDLQEVEEDVTLPIVEPVTQQEPVETQLETVEEVQTQDLRRSTRVRQEPDRYLGFLVSQDEGDLNEPTSYGEVVSGSESEQWQEVMKAEMQSMYDNQVWELTNLPQHCRAVGRKWGFKKKTDMDGNVHTFKARLVAKSFTQTHGIDYDETFSPVAMLKSIRILMAISAYFNYEIWQMDVKTAFLNGKLTKEVYMQQPEGFVDPKNPNKVCKLLKSIYGLKQTSRSWNLHFDVRIKEFGFTKSEFEPCVYTKLSGSVVTFLVLYVDDNLLIGNDIPTLQSVKAWLSKCFQMKDLGEAAYILGIKIYRNRSTRLIGLSQSTYIDKILKRFRMDESKKKFIPMQHGIVLRKAQCPVCSEDQDKMKSVPYAYAIGSIMYAMLCTRPDVAYSVSVTSRYQQNPGEAHWVAVKNILKYMRRTKEMFLVFGGSEDEISVGNQCVQTRSGKQN